MVMLAGLRFAQVERYIHAWVKQRVDPSVPPCDGAKKRMHSGKADRAAAAPPRRQHELLDREGIFRGETRLALGMLFCAALVIGWPWLSGRVTIPWDAKAHFLPQIQFLAQSLADGQSPFWTPYVFSGHPQIADPQAMIFALPFLALALVDGAPSLWAVDTTMLAMLFLAGAVLILWFRDQNWHWAGGLIAALAFCYGASMAWRIQHTGQVLSLAFLPLAIFACDRALARGSVSWGVAAGVATASIVLGRDQVALLTIYLLAAFAIWRLCTAPPPRRAAALVPFLAAGIVASALAIVPITLTALFAADSNRPLIDYLGAGRGSLHPALLLTLLQPDLFAAAGRMEDYWGPPSFAWQDTGLFVAQNMGVLYIGALPLLLIALAGVRGELWQREVRFFSCAALLALVYALGWYTPVFKILYELLPGVQLFRRPADATFLAGGLAAILAGYAAHRLFSGRRLDLAGQATALVGSLFAVSCLAALLIATWLERLPRVWLPLALATAAFATAGLAVRLVRPLLVAKPALAAAVLVVLVTVDLAYNNGPSTSSALPPSTYDVLEPHTGNATIAMLRMRVVQNDHRRDRIELAGLGFHWPNASLTHELENTLGYNPLRLRLYSAAVGAEDHVGLPEQRKFSPLFPSYRSTLADLLGLRFIATGVPIEQIDRSLRPGDLKLLARTSDGYVYENPGALDRVHFASEAKVADFGRMLREGRWPAVDLASTVLLEKLPAKEGPRRPGQARIVSYQNTHVRLEVDSPDGGWAVLNDVWHPWWYADLDGKPAELLQANVLFRAVAVPPGHHEVHLSFRPLKGGWAELAQKWARPSQN